MLKVTAIAGVISFAAGILPRKNSLPRNWRTSREIFAQDPHSLQYSVHRRHTPLREIPKKVQDKFDIGRIMTDYYRQAAARGDQVCQQCLVNEGILWSAKIQIYRCPNTFRACNANSEGFQWMTGNDMTLWKGYWRQSEYQTNYPFPHFRIPTANLPLERRTRLLELAIHYMCWFWKTILIMNSVFRRCSLTIKIWMKPAAYFMPALIPRHFPGMGRVMLWSEDLISKRPWPNRPGFHTNGMFLMMWPNILNDMIFMNILAMLWAYKVNTPTLCWKKWTKNSRPFSVQSDRRADSLSGANCAELFRLECCKYAAGYGCLCARYNMLMSMKKK